MRTFLLVGLMIAFMVTSADARRRGHSYERHGIASVVPSEWTLQPPDPNWRGKRFVSPEGDAWLALYKTPADKSVAAHMKAVAFVDGEEITYLRREKDWIVVSGYKGDNGDRIFFRKAMLACGNESWHHISFEYPAAEKRAFDRLVARTSRALKLHENDGCNPDVAER